MIIYMGELGFVIGAFGESDSAGVRYHDQDIVPLLQDLVVEIVVPG